MLGLRGLLRQTINLTGGIYLRYYRQISLLVAGFEAWYEIDLIAQSVLMDVARQNVFRPFITARLAEIEKELAVMTDSTEVIAPDVSIGRLSRLDAMQHQQMALAGKQRHEEERARLVAAEFRIDEGTYGGCLLCGNDIAVERLEYQPDAVRCVTCAQRKK